jgi:thioredoxin 1
MLSTPPSSLNDFPKMIIDCSAESFCPPCRAIAPIFKALEKQFPSIQFYKIDIEEFPDFANQLNIQNVPTFISIRNGIVVSQFSGANEHRLRNMLNELNTI